jgi:hypothetical protein
MFAATRVTTCGCYRLLVQRLLFAERRIDDKRPEQAHHAEGGFVEELERARTALTCCQRRRTALLRGKADDEIFDIALQGSTSLVAFAMRLRRAQMRASSGITSKARANPNRLRSLPTGRPIGEPESSFRRQAHSRSRRKA